MAKTQGFTLVEVMITLALVGLVIVGGYNFYFYVNRSFFGGATIADVQKDTQLAVQIIIEQVRLAQEMKLTNPNHSLATAKDYLIYCQQGSIMLKNGGNTIVLLQGDQNKTAYSIKFSKAKGSNNELLNGVLHIALTATNPKTEYTLESDLQILNLSSEKIKGDFESTALYYYLERAPKVI